MIVKLNIRQKPRRHQSAFSLVEMMVGSGVLGIVVVSLFAGFSYGFSIIQLAREELRATQILEERMETIRLYNWDQINQAGFVTTNFQAALNPLTQTNGFYYGTILVTNSPLTEDYKTNVLQVTVSITWTNANVKRTQDITTLVSRYGIQNYVY